MNIWFSRFNEEPKNEQINFRVTSDEKIALTLMDKKGNVGDFLRERVFGSVEYLSYCYQSYLKAKDDYQQLLKDLKKLAYEELVETYEELFSEVEDLFLLEEGDSSNKFYETEDETLRTQFLLQIKILSQYRLSNWQTQYSQAYAHYQARQFQEQEVLKKLPTIEFFEESSH